MTRCYPPPRMRWSGATGAIARCKRVSTGCGRKRRSVRVLRWICGVKPTPKAGNKPLPHSIGHGLDKPGVFTTVSIFHPSRVQSELLHKYIEQSFVEVTLLPACHREDVWLRALLHAQILSAYQIERRQRGVEMKI